MGTYSFANEAVKDIGEIGNYIAKNNPKSASQFFDTIRLKCKLVANFPSMGKSYQHLSPNLRGIIVEDYIIFYYPREDGIIVARVVSGYRDLESLFGDG